MNATIRGAGWQAISVRSSLQRLVEPELRPSMGGSTSVPACIGLQDAAAREDANPAFVFSVATRHAIALSFRSSSTKIASIARAS
jgi:hypothetical protein